MRFKTPLYDAHRALNAKIIDFNGWAMPLHYGSAIDEHLKVRESVGVFDVSHMTIVDVLGPGARLFLRKVLTNDVDKMQHTGKALYSCMCNEHGGIVDDLIVYLRAPDNYRLVLNSATKERDLKWLHKNIQGFKAGIQERNDLAILAIQGPKAFETVLSLLKPHEADNVSTIRAFECVEFDDWFFARTGYTGEDGLEISLPQEKITDFFNLLITNGIQPCGLAARDSLRLEAGLLLYGQDMDENTSLLESNLEWVVSFEPKDRDFIGMGALLAQKEEGIKHKLFGLVLTGSQIMRHGYEIDYGAQSKAHILSGGYSPSLKKSIALARLPKDVGSTVLIKIRDTEIPAIVGSTRFIKNNKITKEWHDKFNEFKIYQNS